MKWQEGSWFRLIWWLHTYPGKVIRLWTYLRLPWWEKMLSHRDTAPCQLLGVCSCCSWQNALSQAMSSTTLLSQHVLSLLKKSLIRTWLITLISKCSYQEENDLTSTVKLHHVCLVIVALVYTWSYNMWYQGFRYMSWILYFVKWHIFHSKMLSPWNSWSINSCVSASK